MVVDKAIHQILATIIHNPTITGIELEGQFGLTRKQLSYRLKKVNDFLESNHLEPIKRFKTGKLSVPKMVLETFRDGDDAMKTGRYIYSEDERCNLIT